MHESWSNSGQLTPQSEHHQNVYHQMTVVWPGFDQHLTKIHGLSCEWDDNVGKWKIMWWKWQKPRKKEGNVSGSVPIGYIWGWWWNTITEDVEISFHGTSEGKSCVPCSKLCLIQLYMWLPCQVSTCQGNLTAPLRNLKNMEELIIFQDFAWLKMSPKRIKGDEMLVMCRTWAEAYN